MYEKCCALVEKVILIKDECDKKYNTEFKAAKCSLRHEEKKYRQDKANELKHNEFRPLRHLKCELVTRTKALYNILWEEVKWVWKRFIKKLRSIEYLNREKYELVTYYIVESCLFHQRTILRIFPLVKWIKSREVSECHGSEDIFWIPDFPLNIIYVLAPVTIEQKFASIKKND